MAGYIAIVEHISLCKTYQSTYDSDKIMHALQNIYSVDNTVVHHPDVVGASPTGAAPATSSFST